MKYIICSLSFLLVLALISSCNKSSSSSASTNGKYFPTVKAIIQNNCLSCHSSTGSWSGRPTSFDTDSSIAADYSIIKQSVAGPFTFTIHQMPQGGSLSTSDINTIIAWYDKGGKTTD